MDLGEKSEVFSVIFPSVEAFRNAFLGKGEDRGVFIRTQRAVTVGHKVQLRLGIEGRPQRIPFLGTVTRRRAKSGGVNLPAGLFVTLSEMDADRLDGIARFFDLSEQIRERREHERLPLLVSARYSTAKGEFDSFTRDLSRGGAFLRCKGPLMEVGARFPLRLYLLGAEGPELKLEAEVAWVDVLQAGKGMGVAFVSRSTALRKLSRTLKRLEKNFKTG
ncbi:MAG: PilZ domain-containing protein [Deltaproteobacteria bacterium]|nr:PilZ domain-containing protein [Deltaproteobacteria bacterium]